MDGSKCSKFYTGINPYLCTDTQHEQALLHAVSDDLVTWTKLPEEVWYADESIYERHDWRNPFVFKHPQTDRYTMILAARLNQTRLEPSWSQSDDGYGAEGPMGTAQP